VPVGKIVYTQFLNKTAGIEADVTVTRIEEDCYLVVTPAASRVADFTWMRRNKGKFNVVVTDVTTGEGVLAIMGPRSRELLQAVSPNDFSNDANPLRDGDVVGYLTSGGYGHHLGAAIGMGYVPCAQPGEAPAEMLASTYEIDVMGTRVKAEAQLKPFYDPKGERAKA